MKSDVTEVLIPIMDKRSESNISILKAFVGCVLLIVLGLAIVRYENKICQLEIRMATLEIESIRNEYHYNQDKETRRKREANPGGGHSGPSWVERSGSGDPQLNPEYMNYLRGQSQRARSTDDHEYTVETHRQGGSRTEQRLRSGGRRRVGESSEAQLIRNNQDEKFFTRNQDGSYVSPSGLKEIYERLPHVSNEVNYQTPNLETRAYGSAGVNAIGAYPPVRQVGTGSDQVRARVIRFDDNDSSSNSKLVAVAAHYVADVSNFTANENPRLRNSNGIFQIWRPADWMSGDNFSLDKINGAVTVRKDGIYHIYAQIHYHDVQENSFMVEVNEVPFVQCTTTQESNSCFTAGIAHLRPNDKIVIKNIGIDRFSIYKPEKSFFGLMKVGNAY